MRRSAFAAVLILTVAGSLARAAGPYDDLLKHTSANTNTLVLIDVKAAIASPLAKAEKWKEKGEPNNRGGLGFVPDSAEAVVIASEINLNSLDRDFQVGLVKMRNVPNMGDLAKIENGTVDTIADRLAVLSPRNVYFTTLSGSELVAVYPADRQYTARWLRSVKNAKSGALSDYLKKAADKATANTITIAVDLDDVVDKTLMKFSLAGSPSVAKNKNVDVSLLAGFLAGVKGLTFAVKVDEGITGTLTVEFAGDPTNFRRTLPDLLLELIDSQGVWIPGMDKWEVKFTDHAISMTGPMTTPDLKRVISLFAFPHAGGGGGEEPVKGQDATVSATKRYLQAVDTILTDIKPIRDGSDYLKTATWHEKAADQIDHLSTQNVDPIAAAAAQEAAKRLRAIAGSLQGVPIDVNALANQQYYYQFSGGPSYGANLGWWGWSPYYMQSQAQIQTNIPEIQSKISKARSDDEKKRMELWSEINRIMMEARKKLNDKYKGGF